MKRAMLIAAATASTALASLPPLGGPMNHVLVTLGPDGAIALAVERAGEQTLVEAPETYDGPAGMLNGTRFNAQYGWLVSGLWAPPPGASVYIEAVSQSQGLSVYCGRAFGPHGFMDPVLGTGDAPTRLAWDGVMLHNYYAATSPGHYVATYRVFIGDGAGEPVAGILPGEITLGWVWPSECPADLAQPLGVLDLADITAFVSAFVGATPGADLAEPFGVFDLADVVAFAGAFSAGCP